MAIDRNSMPYSINHIENMGFDPDFQLPWVEGLGYDGQNIQRKNADNLTYQFDYAGGTNPVYIGKAAPGTATSDALWLILKLTFDGNNNVTQIQYPNGSSSFNQIWDNRASLAFA